MQQSTAVPPTGVHWLERLLSSSRAGVYGPCRTAYVHQEGFGPCDRAVNALFRKSSAEIRLGGYANLELRM